MTKVRAQRWLSVVWLCGTVAIAGVLIVQAVVFDVWGNNGPEVWEWFTKALVPTATLMLGVVVTTTAESGGRRTVTHRFAFRLALGLSLFYLASLFLVLLTMSLQYSVRPMERANELVATIQGLANASLGAFFVLGGGSGDAEAGPQDD